MPCTTHVPDPDIEALKNTLRLLDYARFALAVSEKLAPSEMPFLGETLRQKLAAAIQHTDRATRTLCGIMSSLSVIEAERITMLPDGDPNYWNAKDLRRWWEAHRKFDEDRKAHEDKMVEYASRLESAKQKLTTSEYEAVVNNAVGWDRFFKP